MPVENVKPRTCNDKELAYKNWLEGGTTGGVYVSNISGFYLSESAPMYLHLLPPDFPAHTS